MERFANMIECKICVKGRQINNIVNSGGVCRECRVDLTHDNININYGSICIRCTKNAKAVTNEKNKINVQCNDCGATFRKHENRSGKAVKEFKLCDNYINEVGLLCKLICQETKVVGDIKMRCRNKRYTNRRGDKDIIYSKCCGVKDKCKSLKKLSDDDHWFVCLAVQDDRKTPESLPTCEDTAIVSSENDQDDRKMAAV
jgi:predicted nucleic acid-binding Zn ribbon protein